MPLCGATLYENSLMEGRAPASPKAMPVEHRGVGGLPHSNLRFSKELPLPVRQAQ
jgi:hypothetical protein